VSLYAALADSAAALRTAFHSLINADEGAGEEPQRLQGKAEDTAAAAVFSMSQLVAWSQEVAAMYRKELTMRCCLTQHLRLALDSRQSHSLSRSTAALYLSCCTLQPFMQTQRLADIQRSWQHESDALKRR
jgi:hypothetical protein